MQIRSPGSGSRPHTERCSASLQPPTYKKDPAGVFNGACSRLSCCTAAQMCSLLPVMSDTPPPLSTDGL